MNSAYKTIWSSVRRAFVVCNEFTRSHGKQKSVCAAVTGALMALAAAGSAGAEPISLISTDTKSAYKTIAGETLSADSVETKGTSGSIQAKLSLTNGAKLTVTGDAVVRAYSGIEMDPSVLNGAASSELTVGGTLTLDATDVPGQRTNFTGSNGAKVTAGAVNITGGVFQMTGMAATSKAAADGRRASLTAGSVTLTNNSNGGNGERTKLVLNGTDAVLGDAVLNDNTFISVGDELVTKKTVTLADGTTQWQMVQAGNESHVKMNSLTLTNTAFKETNRSTTANFHGGASAEVKGAVNLTGNSVLQVGNLNGSGRTDVAITAPGYVVDADGSRLKDADGNYQGIRGSFTAGGTLTLTGAYYENTTTWMRPSANFYNTDVSLADVVMNEGTSVEFGGQYAQSAAKQKSLVAGSQAAGTVNGSLALTSATGNYTKLNLVHGSSLTVKGKTTVTGNSGIAVEGVLPGSVIDGDQAVYTENGVTAGLRGSLTFEDALKLDGSAPSYQAYLTAANADVTAKKGIEANIGTITLTGQQINKDGANRFIAGTGSTLDVTGDLTLKSLSKDKNSYLATNNSGSTVKVSGNLSLTGNGIVTVEGIAAGNALTADGEYLTENGVKQGVRASLDVGGNVSLSGSFISNGGTSPDKWAAITLRNADGVIGGKLSLTDKSEFSVSGQNANSRYTASGASTLKVAGGIEAEGITFWDNAYAAVSVYDGSSLETSTVSLTGMTKITVSGRAAGMTYDNEGYILADESGSPAILRSTFTVTGDMTAQGSRKADSTGTMRNYQPTIVVTNGDFAVGGNLKLVKSSVTLDGNAATRKKADGSNYTAADGKAQFVTQKGTGSRLTAKSLTLSSDANSLGSTVFMKRGSSVEADTIELHGNASLNSNVDGVGLGFLAVDTKGIAIEGGVKNTVKTGTLTLKGMKGTNDAGEEVFLRPGMTHVKAEIIVEDALTLENSGTIILNAIATKVYNSDGTAFAVDGNANQNYMVAGSESSLTAKTITMSSSQAQQGGISANSGSHLTTDSVDISGNMGLSVSGIGPGWLADGETYGLKRDSDGNLVGQRGTIEIKNSAALSGYVVEADGKRQDRQASLTASGSDITIGGDLTLTGLAAVKLNSGTITRRLEDGITTYRTPLRNGTENLTAFGAQSALTVAGALTMKSDVIGTDNNRKAKVDINGGSTLTAASLSMTNLSNITFNGPAAGYIGTGEGQIATDDEGDPLALKSRLIISGNAVMTGDRAVFVPQGSTIQDAREGSRESQITGRGGSVEIGGDLTLNDYAYIGLQAAQAWREYTDENGAKQTQTGVSAGGAPSLTASAVILINSYKTSTAGTTNINLSEGGALTTNALTLSGKTSVRVEGQGAGYVIGTDRDFLRDENGDPVGKRGTLAVDGDVKLTGYAETIDGKMTGFAAGITLNMADFTAEGNLTMTGPTSFSAGSMTIAYRDANGNRLDGNGNIVAKDSMKAVGQGNGSVVKVKSFSATNDTTVMSTQNFTSASKLIADSVTLYGRNEFKFSGTDNWVLDGNGRLVTDENGLRAVERGVMQIAGNFTAGTMLSTSSTTYDSRLTVSATDMAVEGDIKLGNNTWFTAQSFELYRLNIDGSTYKDGDGSTLKLTAAGGGTKITAKNLILDNSDRIQTYMALNGGSSLTVDAISASGNAKVRAQGVAADTAGDTNAHAYTVNGERAGVRSTIRVNQGVTLTSTSTGNAGLEATAGDITVVGDITMNGSSYLNLGVMSSNAKTSADKAFTYANSDGTVRNLLETVDGSGGTLTAKVVTVNNTSESRASVRIDGGSSLTVDSFTFTGKGGITASGSGSGHVIGADRTFARDEEGKRKANRASLTVKENMLISTASGTRTDGVLYNGTMTTADITVGGSFTFEGDGTFKLASGTAMVLESTDEKGDVTPAKNADGNTYSRNVSNAYSTLTVAGALNLRSVDDAQLKAGYGVNLYAHWGTRVSASAINVTGSATLSLANYDDNGLVNDSIDTEGTLLTQTDSDGVTRASMIRGNLTAGDGTGAVNIAGALYTDNKGNQGARTATIKIVGSDAAVGAVSLTGASNLTLAGALNSRKNADGTRYTFLNVTNDQWAVLGGGSVMTVTGDITGTGETSYPTATAQVSVQHGSSLTVTGGIRNDGAGRMTVSASGNAAGTVLRTDGSVAVDAEGDQLAARSTLSSAGDITLSGRWRNPSSTAQLWASTLSGSIADITATNVTLTAGAAVSLSGGTAPVRDESGNEVASPNNASWRYTLTQEGTGATLKLSGDFTQNIEEVPAADRYVAVSSMGADSVLEAENIVFKGGINAKALDMKGNASGSVIDKNGHIIEKELHTSLIARNTLSLTGSLVDVENGNYKQGSKEGANAMVPSEYAAYVYGMYSDVKAKTLKLGASSKLELAHGTLEIDDPIRMEGGAGRTFTAGTVDKNGVDMSNGVTRQTASLILSDADFTAPELTIGQYSYVTLSSYTGKYFNNAGWIAKACEYSTGKIGGAVTITNNTAGAMDRTSSLAVNGASTFESASITGTGYVEVSATGSAYTVTEDGSSFTNDEQFAQIKTGDITLTGAVDMGKYNTNYNAGYTKDGAVTDTPSARNATLKLNRGKIEANAVTVSEAGMISAQAGGTLTAKSIELTGSTGLTYAEGTMQNGRDISGQIVRGTVSMAASDSARISADTVKLGKHTYGSLAGGRRTLASDGKSYYDASKAAVLTVKDSFVMENSAADEQETRRDYFVQQGALLDGSTAEASFTGNVRLQVTGLAAGTGLESAESTEVNTDYIASTVKFKKLTLSGVEGTDKTYGAAVLLRDGAVMEISDELILNAGAAVDINSGASATVDTLVLAGTGVSVSRDTTGTLNVKNIRASGTADSITSVSLAGADLEGAFTVRDAEVALTGDIAASQFVAIGSAAVTGNYLVSADTINLTDAHLTGMVAINAGGTVSMKNSTASTIDWRNDVNYDYSANTASVIDRLVVLTSGFKTTTLTDWESKGVTVKNLGLFLKDIDVSADTADINVESTGNLYEFGGFVDWIAPQAGTITVGSDASGKTIHMDTKDAISFVRIGDIDVGGEGNTLILAGTGETQLGNLFLTGSGGTAGIFAESADAASYTWSGDEGANRTAVIGTAEKRISVSDINGVRGAQLTGGDIVMDLVNVDASHIGGLEKLSGGKDAKEMTANAGNISIRLKDSTVANWLDIIGESIGNGSESYYYGQTVTGTTGNISTVIEGSTVYCASLVDNFRSMATPDGIDAKTGLTSDFKRGDVLYDIKGGSTVNVIYGAYVTGGGWSAGRTDHFTGEYGNFTVNLDNSETGSASVLRVMSDWNLTAGDVAFNLENGSKAGEIVAVDAYNAASVKTGAISVTVKDSEVAGRTGIFGIMTSAAAGAAQTVDVKSIDVSLLGSSSVGGAVVATWDKGLRKADTAHADDVAVTVGRSTLSIGSSTETADVTLRNTVSAWDNIAVHEGSTLSLTGESADYGSSVNGKLTLEGQLNTAGDVTLSDLTMGEASHLNVGKNSTVTAGTIGSQAAGAEVSIFSRDAVQVTDGTWFKDAKINLLGSKWDDAVTSKKLVNNFVTIGGEGAETGDDAPAVTLTEVNDTHHFTVAKNGTLKVDGIKTSESTDAITLAGGTLSTTLESLFTKITKNLLKIDAADSSDTVSYNAITGVGAIKAGVTLTSGTLNLTTNETTPFMASVVNDITKALSQANDLQVNMSQVSVEDLTVTLANKVQSANSGVYVTFTEASVKNDEGKTKLVVGGTDTLNNDTARLESSMGFKSISGVTGGVTVSKDTKFVLTGGIWNTPELADGDITAYGTLRFGSYGMESTTKGKLNHTVTVNGSGTLEVRNGEFTVDKIDTKAGGTVTVEEGATLDGSTFVIAEDANATVETGAELASDDLTVDGTLTGAGAITVRGTLHVTHTGVVQNQSTRTRARTAASLTAKTGTFDAGSNVTYQNGSFETLSSAGTASFGNLAVTGDAQVTGGTVAVTNTAVMNNLTLTNDAAWSDGASKGNVLTVSDKASFTSKNAEWATMNITGTVNADALTVTDTLTNGGTVTAKTVNVKNLKNTGNLTATALTLTGDSEVTSGEVRVTDSVNIEKLTLSGDAKWSDGGGQGKALTVESGAAYTSKAATWEDVAVKGTMTATGLTANTVDNTGTLTLDTLTVSGTANASDGVLTVAQTAQGGALKVGANGKFVASSKAAFNTVDNAGTMDVKTLSASYFTNTGTATVDSMSLTAGQTVKAAGGSLTINAMTSEGGVIDVTDDVPMTVANLTNGTAGTTVLVASNKANILTVTASKGKTMVVRGTSDLNFGQDAFTQEYLQTIADTVDVQSGTDDYTVYLPEGKVMGAITAAVVDGVVQWKTEEFNSALKAAGDIASLTYLGWRGQMDDVHKRLGDLRTQPESSGAWARYTGGKMKYGDMGLKNTYNTIQVGSDARAGNAYFGASASYTDDDGKVKNGKNEGSQTAVSLYAGYLGGAGQFVDVSLKGGRIATDYKVSTSSGIATNAKFSTYGAVASVEAGWRFNSPSSGIYLEPQAQMTFGHVKGVNYTTSSGVAVSQKGINSLIGRFGVAAGYRFAEKKGAVYAKASILHDWKADTAINFGGEKTYAKDLAGTWGEFAIGGSYTAAKGLSFYGEISTTSGTKTMNPVQVTGGIRYAF